MSARDSGTVFRSLEEFRIEIPSWGFANTRTRFGKFLQPAAAATTEEKFSDAGLSQCCQQCAEAHACGFPDRDFGAESGRAVLAHLHSGVITTDEVYRFANQPVDCGGLLHWDAPIAVARGTPTLPLRETEIYKNGCAKSARAAALNTLLKHAF